MALAAPTLPYNLPERSVPQDANLTFTTGQTITSTGYFSTGGATQLDLLSGARKDGYWCIDVSALDLSSGDETYRLFLLGSNDQAWGNGNVEILATRDFGAASSGRLIATIVPASYAVPITGRTATRFAIPFTNFIGAYSFRYLQMYGVLGGTTPSITLSSWITFDDC